MKNEEKFKTLEDRKVAFKKFCNKYDCTNCPVPGNVVSVLESCSRIWLRLQAEEEGENHD